MRHLTGFLACAALLAAGGAAHAQPAPAYPTQTVQIVVPYSAGGSTDVLARALAEGLRQAFGKPFIVVDKPGASGMIGADLVAKARPDGHTLLMGYTGEMVVAPQLYANASYRATDFAPIVLAGETPLILIARKDLPGATLTDFLAVARGAPGRFNFGLAGTGSPAHFANALLSRLAGITIVQVPYKGSSQAVADIIAGQVDLFFSGLAPVVPQLHAATLKAYAVTGDHRAPTAPEVPTMAELGFAGFDLSGWFGLFAPAGTPAAVIDSLKRATLAALDGAALRAAMALQGVEVRPLADQALAGFIAGETAKYRRLISELGISVE
jgi:tripartite-type tricarboxylate transporter receptor subunit TctC